MSGGGSNGRAEVARGASAATAKTAALVGLAVLIGIVLLQVVDVEPSPTREGGGKKVAVTTTTAKGGVSTTTAPATPERTPDQLRVIVLNGGAPSGAAGTMSDALKQKGYTNQAQANNDPTKRTGNAVYCKEGLDREAAALSIAVGEVTTVESYPAAPPKAVTDAQADCVVVVGGTGTTPTT